MSNLGIVVQIGNSDDKLSQKSWSDFFKEVHETVKAFAASMYFTGTSDGHAPWQNATFVFSVDEVFVDALKHKLTEIRGRYSQDSVAWSVCDTTFI